MEQMIWFLRSLILFLAFLGIFIFSQSNAVIAHSTKTSLNFDQSAKILLQSYFPKLYKIPNPGETLDIQLYGEDLKLTVIEFVPNEKISWKIEGFANYESLKEIYYFRSVENQNLVEGSAELTPKSNLSSRVIFAFFGKHWMQSENEKNLKKL
ncbi:hypothetical protein [Leptospira idonii]|uniref:Uncharacterized protein n=1 Tax=Leptospira idonii TaxID=1193500 RepID=A0A4V3JYD7_9LEPT|nr:hypothetical protein [Leptospira idonii]TGN20846.1 hypothetical protein EHS15_01240 [Leptospira idonii]